MPAGSIAELVSNVRGRVELDGAPVTFFAIAYESADHDHYARGGRIAIHTMNGAFATAVPWGRWNLVIAAPGAARHEIAGVDVEAKLDLGTISLDHGYTLTGVVRDHAGQPVPNARVDFTAHPTFGRPNELQELINGNISTRADATGHYTIRGAGRSALGPRQASLVASTTYLRSAPVAAPDVDASVDLEVLPTGALVVTVNDGDPLVRVTNHGFPLRGERIAGRWRFDGLPAGTYDVDVIRPEWHPRIHQTATVHAGEVESMTLAMPSLAPVEVRLTSAKAACTAIQLRDLDDREVAIAPCADRVATFPRIEPGTYVACVDKHDCSPIVVEDSPAQQKLDVPRP